MTFRVYFLSPGEQEQAGRIDDPEVAAAEADDVPAMLLFGDADRFSRQRLADEHVRAPCTAAPC